MNETDLRTAPKPASRTKKTMIVWLIMHGLIVLGWSVFWTNFQRLYQLGENGEDQAILTILQPTALAVPAMVLINVAILIVAAIRKERFLLLLWLLDFTLVLAQMKFMLPLYE